MLVALQHTCGGLTVFSFLTLMYGFLAMFVVTSLERNRRKALRDAPILTYAGHGLMAASIAGAALFSGAAAWVAFVHPIPLAI